MTVIIADAPRDAVTATQVLLTQWEADMRRTHRQQYPPDDMDAQLDLDAVIMTRVSRTWQRLDRWTQTVPPDYRQAWPTEGRNATPQGVQVMGWVDAQLAPPTTDGARSRVLLLMGTPGAGKTRDAWAACTAWVARTAATHRLPVVWRTSELLRMVLTPTDDRAAAEQTWQYARDAPLLVLDEFCAAAPTAAGVTRMLELLSHRGEHHLPLIVTTNQDWEGIKRFWGQESLEGGPIPDRLRHTATAVVYGGPTLREAHRG